MNFDRETMPGWRNLPSPSTLPDRPFEIDYVRSWKKAERAKSDDDARASSSGTPVLAPDVCNSKPRAGVHYRVATRGGKNSQKNYIDMHRPLSSTKDANKDI